MLDRAKRIAAVILAESTRPAVLAVMSHNMRGALADLAAELVEINQRLNLLEKTRDEQERLSRTG